jgi:tRNA (mo5U34)-methyltransferase
VTDLLQERVSAPSPARETEIAALGPWFHNLHLPDGSLTAPSSPLGDFPRVKWERISLHLPERMDGWRVLDIGCNAGFYTIEAARRGAVVTAMDIDGHFLRQARWAVSEFGLGDRVEFRQMQVYDLARTRESWDLVLFMGVFYHLRYPMLGLDIVCEKVERVMVFQTLTMPGQVASEPPDDLDIMNREPLSHRGWPKLAFIEKKLAGDGTNWWAPNHSAVEALLRTSGMRVIARPGHEIYVCEPAAGGAISDPGVAAQLDAATGRHRDFHGAAGERL